MYLGLLICVWTPTITIEFINLYFFYLAPRNTNLSLLDILYQIQFAYLSTMILLVIPTFLLILLILYFRIYLKIRNLMNFRNGKRNTISGMITILRSPSLGNTDINVRLKELKTTLVLLITVLYIFFGWIPAILAVYSVQTPVDNFPHLFVIVQSLLNPFLYAFHTKAFTNRLNWLNSKLTCTSTSKNTANVVSPNEVSFKNFDLKFEEEN